MVYDERLHELQDKYGAGRLTILGIDSNSNETRAEIERNASNRKLPFAILLDEDGSLADKLQATLSPSFYVIDTVGTIRYLGSLDNNKKPGDKARIAYLEQALDDIFAGRPVANAENPASGCTIRRRTF
jgi:peroxiredoxin